MIDSSMTNGVLTALFIMVCSCLNGYNLPERQAIDMTSATIYAPDEVGLDLSKIRQVLREEVKKRSGIDWAISDNVLTNANAQVIILSEGKLHMLPEAWQSQINRLKDIESEGYKIMVMPEISKVLIIANDRRSALYGVGKLLRKMEARKGSVLVPSNLYLSTSPAYPIRGHQLGYRPKTNSYDAWSAAQFDQYIRELALFGANSIEIMPPRTDDDFESRHMKTSAMEMIASQSASCESYDIDVWMWYPNMGEDYQHPDSIAKELKERDEVFSNVTRLDHLFVPGGDPGDVEPAIMFTWLEQVSKVLARHHPKAKIWISPQVFRPTFEWLNTFFEHINKKPDWLGGVVFGPWVKMPIDEIRAVVREDIPIRRYPDITHSLSSQYPIPNWDLALASTLGRECINPRPKDQKMIHNALDQFADGSLSYSEGTNDDVNKFIWSDQDWDPNTEVIETLRDYSRLFVDPDFTEEIALGLQAQEKNIQGPLAINESVLKTLLQWQQIEAKSTPELRDNFRYQMGVIRAYFDAYIQKRLIYETFLEQEARDILGSYGTLGVDASIEACKNMLARAWEDPIDDRLKKRCLELADALYASIGAQLTIEKHGAHSGRGNFIDNIDNPLNDVAWITSALHKVEEARSEADKITEIETLLNRNNPGPGGFYDNFGDVQSWKRLIVHEDYDKDPGNLRTPRVGFGVGLAGQEWVHEIKAMGFEGEAAPRAWMHQATTLYDLPLEILYEDLNPDDTYTISVSYTGRFRSRMKMKADGILIHDFIKTGVQPTYEFEIPREALRDGKVVFSWTCGEAERGSQVSEIWIRKK